MQKVINFLEELITALRASMHKKPVPTLAIAEDSQLVPRWHKIAKKEVGVGEYEIGHNARIIEYHSATKLSAKDQDTAWCASFVCWCLEQAGVDSTRSAWAKTYLNWGVKIERPKLGCVVVLSRGRISGHVGFFISETDRTITLLSGNTSNRVCVQVFNRDRVLGYRWPSENR